MWFSEVSVKSEPVYNGVNEKKKIQGFGKQISIYVQCKVYLLAR